MKIFIFMNIKIFIFNSNDEIIQNRNSKEQRLNIEEFSQNFRKDENYCCSKPYRIVLLKIILKEFESTIIYNSIYKYEIICKL